MKVIAFTWIAICAATFAPAQSDDGPVAKVLALEHAWNQAEQRKDTKALDAIFDNGLVYIDYDGSISTKAEFLAHTKSPSLLPEQEIPESMTAHAFGTIVIATGIYVTKGLENGKPYARRGRFLDTWVLKDGKWLCVASQAAPILH